MAGSLGIPEREARWCEQVVRAGATLVTVKADDRFAQALRILRRHGACDVETRDPDEIGYGVAGESTSKAGPTSRAD